MSELYLNKTHKLLSSIQDKAEKEQRSVHELRVEIEDIVKKMYFTGMFTETAVVTICSDLIKLYAMRCSE